MGWRLFRAHFFKMRRNRHPIHYSNSKWKIYGRTAAASKGIRDLKQTLEAVWWKLEI